MSLLIYSIFQLINRNLCLWKVLSAVFLSESLISTCSKELFLYFFVLIFAVNMIPLFKVLFFKKYVLYMMCMVSVNSM